MLGWLSSFFNRRSYTGGRSLTDVLYGANRWREEYNPLRGLNMAQVIYLQDAYLRGEMAEIQWTYHRIEAGNPDLIALVERRLSAISALEWDIKRCEQNSAYDENLAHEQEKALRAAYEKIDNLVDAIRHLALATFRGYAHLEKHRALDNSINHLELVDQWLLVRNGLRGDWKLNPEAASQGFKGLPDSYIIPVENWIVREVDRHIDWIGLPIFVRQSMAQKDYDGFVEIYGLPGAVVIGPPDIPESDASGFEDAAKAVATGGSGYLPYGSEVRFPSDVRGQNPFRDYMSHLTEKLVLAATGGLLTMLTAPTGIGKGPSEEHSDAFHLLALAEALHISAVFQEQFDAEILARHFPGKPALAYFQLADNQGSDRETLKFKRDAWLGFQRDSRVGGIIAGNTDINELTKDVGMPINADHKETDNFSEMTSPNSEDEAILNRQGPIKPNFDLAAAAVASDLAPIRERLERILTIQDPQILESKLIQFKIELPGLLKDINADPKFADVLTQQMLSAAKTPLPERPKTVSGVQRYQEAIKNGLQ